MGNTILITGTNNITGINIIKALQLDESNKVYGCDFSTLNIANKYCLNFQVSNSDKNSYISELLDIVEKYNIKFIIPSNDHELRVLTENISLFLEKNISLNGYGENTLKFLNKSETTSIFLHNKIQTPTEYSKDSLKFPLVVRKNSMGQGKKFVYIISSINEYGLLPEEELNNAVFTQYIEGDEYTIDIICDNNSNVYSIVPRLRRKVINGMVHFAEIIKNDFVIDSVRNLVQKLKLTGVNCVQCIVNSEGCYFIEVNPRPGSGMDLSVNANVNLPQMWLDLNNNLKVEYTQPIWGMKMLRHSDGYYFK